MVRLNFNSLTTRLILLGMAFIILGGSRGLSCSATTCEKV